jgi:hypothetical protein
LIDVSPGVAFAQLLALADQGSLYAMNFVT